LLRRDPGLKQSLCFNQVAHRFRLGKVDPPIQKGAHCELARLGQARAARESELDDVPQNDRGAVRRDLDDVIRGVGMWFGKVGDDDFVNAPVRPGHSSRPSFSGGNVFPCSEAFWFNELAKDSVPGFQRVRQTKHGRCDHSCFRPRQANHANAPAAQRSRNRDDRVVKVHSEDCSGGPRRRRVTIVFQLSFRA
jgi:hypothetical protein